MYVGMSEIVARIKAAKSVDIISHRNPDGDTTGCAVAMYHALDSLGIKARMVCTDPFPSYLQFLLPDKFSSNERGDTVIAVDTSIKKMFGDYMETYQKVDISIDHHTSNEDYAELTLLKDDVSAAGMIVHDVIEALGVEITPKIATALYTTLTTDTGSFKYSNTTAETLELAGKLMRAGADTRLINANIYESKSRALLKAEMMAVNEMIFEGDIALLAITKKIYETSGVSSWSELDPVTAIPRDCEGVKFALVFKETELEVRVSVRTTEPYMAHEFAMLFGGGGHSRAAGFRMIGAELEAAKAEVLKAAKEFVQKSKEDK